MPTPCANGCPFFGTPQTNNLCSACFRVAHSPGSPSGAKCLSSSTAVAAAATAAAATASATTPAPVSSASTTSSNSSSSVAPSLIPSQTSSSVEVQQPTPQLSSPTVSTPNPPVVVEAPISAPAAPTSIPANRCGVCRKKLGLTPFVCRCARSFCAAHRHSGAHACEFDYKAHHRHALARANPAVIAKKLDKI